VSRSLSGFLVVAAILALPFAAALGWNAWYDRSNAQILEEVPVYPGSHRVAGAKTRAVSLRQRELATSVRLPKQTPPWEIERFFERRLDRAWQRLRLHHWGWCFTRGKAALLLRVEELAGVKTMWTMVDARGAGRCAEHPFMYG
jgi:hypothetical protein